MFVFNKNTMIKLTINNAKCHYPLRKAKGSCQDRLNKAIELNNRFFENIKGPFTYGDVSPNIFAQVIQKTADTKKIPIKVIPEPKHASGNLTIDLNSNGKLSGYTLTVPANIESRISRYTTGDFMKQTFRFFESILNPKYLKRSINLINNEYDYMGAKKFFNSHILTNKPLETQDLDKFLKDKSAAEQIDILQAMRYTAIQKLNLFKHTKNYQKKMDAHFRYGHAYNTEVPIKYTQYKLPEKIKIIGSKLFETIQSERAKLANR